MKPKKTITVVNPYNHNPHISCYYELNFGKDVIKPGDKIKVKGARGYFIFHKWAHNSELDISWVDCMSEATGEFRSFYLDSIKSVYRAKKSIRKKLIA